MGQVIDCVKCSARMKVGDRVVERLQGRKGKISCKMCGAKMRLRGRDGTVHRLDEEEILEPSLANEMPSLAISSLDLEKVESSRPGRIPTADSAELDAPVSSASPESIRSLSDDLAAGESLIASQARAFSEQTVVNEPLDLVGDSQDELDPELEVGEALDSSSSIDLHALVDEVFSPSSQSDPLFGRDSSSRFRPHSLDDQNQAYEAVEELDAEALESVRSSR
ncbi:MAG: hypothetical protein MK135_07290, partial [Polyangiaceae bacterium]|nr:hypothetical protein [Polyangiaceae bacterium]